MESGVTEFNIRVYDATNKKIIALGTFSNLIEQKQEIRDFENIPNGPAVLEIQVSKLGGGQNRGVFIDSATVFCFN
jgi:hypothetical protein